MLNMLRCAESWDPSCNQLYKWCQIWLKSIASSILLFRFNNILCNLISVGPENIHTPTRDGIGNSEGVGGQRPWTFRRGRGWTVDLVSRCPLIQRRCIYLAVQNPFLLTKQIFYMKLLESYYI